MSFNTWLKNSRFLLWSLVFIPLTSCSMDFPWTDKEPIPFEQPLPINTQPKRLALGYSFAIGVKEDGTVWSWGGDGKEY